MSLTELIFHHYPQSPVSEKVRVVFGIKALSWRSVEIPRIPPKPDLMPLTGGYRRTPVLQAGADIYCDSLCIIRELERRSPTPSLFPDGTAALAWGLARWTDGAMFDTAVGVVLGSAHATLPPEFANDRARLYFGPGHDLARLGADLPHLLTQLRAQLSWAETSLADGRPYMLGQAAGLVDAVVYYLVWFLRGRYEGGAELLKPFARLREWETRVRDLGHGRSATMGSGEALSVARDAEPEASLGVDGDDPLQIASGTPVAVVPDVDGGDPPVTGRLWALDADTVVVQRDAESLGRINVHFPRAGYRITPC